MGEVEDWKNFLLSGYGFLRPSCILLMEMKLKM